MMKTNGIRTALLALLCALTLLFAAVRAEEEPIDGGTTIRRDYDAPKEIESREIVEYRAVFTLLGEWTPGRENQAYAFTVAPGGDGVLTASEATTGVSLPADTALLEALQEIIETYDLAQWNGIYEVTAGLPPEFDPGGLTVRYASGEALAFTTNNNPQAEWAKRTYLAFAQWFADRGDASLLPPRSTGQVKRIVVDFTENGRRIRYGDISVSEDMAIDGETLLFYRQVREGEGGEEAEALVRFPEDFYDRVSGILDEYDFRAFDPHSALYGLGRPERRGEKRAREDLHIYIAYTDGRRLSIDTSEPEDIESLRPLLDGLFAYFDALFDR